MEKKGDRYQIILIVLGCIATLLFALFVFRELFPEYRRYQQDFIALEKFRETYTKEPAAPFKEGIKQIVLEKPKNGPPDIDRCTSCHVALEIPDYSSTKVAKDNQGNILFGKEGFPLQIPNENYVFFKLDQAINETKDPVERQAYEDLKTVKVGEFVYDLKKVLVGHPLIGKETRPFEHHPIEEYGCTVCHNGNGRGLTTQKAHGPVFDGSYEIEKEGSDLKFNEEDPLNDPPFSKMFNHKPGDSLLFQTTPLFPAPLMQAKCIQCHTSKKIGVEEENKSELEIALLREATVKKTPSTIDLLTKNYQRGKELYLAQSCYACHKIAGFTRGGVGPELTQAGDLYPWFLKESIVWPQADLKTSTMPNYKLDHADVQDLMTFLLAQKAEPPVEGSLKYRQRVQKWEAGEKMPWERAILPHEMEEISFGMTVFATQGCAACHRLKGFTSEVGFEKEKNLKDEKERHALLEDKKWFEKLFPEDILGSDLVKVLDAYGKEIDEKIIQNIKEPQILEEIEQKFPGTILTFYPPFQFANRAKDHALNKEERLLWKNRVHRVLMQFIQEYGLGRLIGPRPNWSGVYRSDEWLMEHFRKPTSHVPRSIMPIFPFDETKFYALTKMLDTLALRNVSQERLVWQEEGFNPQKAYHMYCSQCHGSQRGGNGPVSEWIYPIAKNLSNPDFLRNLTREKAIQSILYGVKGTPMPPWGEGIKGEPILTEKEASALVDWLFTFLPGSEVIKEEKQVPKWQYTLKDVLEELKQSSFQEKKTLDAIFSLQAPLPADPNVPAYFIKKSLYTNENLAQGKAFFELNCASCHGLEGDGSGNRAEAMKEAKPRMLTNLDWLASRDDLRLLRSIKFGVPGTAMSPWGDQTSPLQRLQLVMFIRSLTDQMQFNQQLSEAIYRACDEPKFLIDRARIPLSKKIEAEESYLKTKKEKEKGFLEELKERDLEEASVNYKEQLVAFKQLAEFKKQDQKFVEIKELLDQEALLWKEFGSSLISLFLQDQTILNDYFNVILAQKNRFTFVQGQLRWEEEKKGEEKKAQFLTILEQKIQEKIAQLDQFMSLEGGKMESLNKKNTLFSLENQKKNFQSLSKIGKKIFIQITQLQKQQQKSLLSL